MSSINEINSVAPDTAEPSEKGYIKHLHIGLFFDGTNNNMVQQSCYSSNKVNFSVFSLGKKKPSIDSLKKEKETLAKIPGNEIAIKDINARIKSYEEKSNVSETSRQTIYKLRAELHKLNLSYIAKVCSPEYRKPLTDYDIEPLEELITQIKEKEEEIDEASAQFDITDQELMDYSTESGFSNIAVLYSLFNCEAFEQSEEQPSKSIKFYIEGSGANDMSSNTTNNINGLGFGLGLTGVTALVSKGIKRVNNYIESLSSYIDDNTKIHFYVFGFSRGATCARLFTHIATREGEGLLKAREHEFGDFIPTYIGCDGKVKFLECITVRKNITVDFLGIYDTVASIGLLKQKDGWIDSLGAPYENMPNYRYNWHYKNATQYGLYICKNPAKLKNVCHIGALDEFRENFAFTNVGFSVPENAVEILLPGCHSDVGGGYMSGEEQEISLPFYAEKEVWRGDAKKNRKLRTLLPLKSYTKKPATEYIPCENPNLETLDSSALNLKTLTFVGWINNWEEEQKKDKKERATISVAKYQSNYTENTPLGQWNYLNKVYFKRYVNRGWSDLTLALMIERAKIAVADLVFKPSLIYDYKKTIRDQDIKVLAEKILTKGKSYGLNKRYILIPGGNIASDIYKKLRLNYLHFTSSNSIIHLKGFRNWELNGICDGSGANFGNKPNFDMQGMLCRLTYHGENISELADNTNDGKHAQHVHYMYELCNYIEESI